MVVNTPALGNGFNVNTVVICAIVHADKAQFNDLNHADGKMMLGKKEKRADMNREPPKLEIPFSESASAEADTVDLPDAEHLLARLETVKQQVDDGINLATEQRSELRIIANALVPLIGQAKSIDKKFLAFLIELAAIEALNELAEIDL